LCVNLLYIRKCLVCYFIFQKVVKWCLLIVGCIIGYVAIPCL